MRQKSGLTKEPADQVIKDIRRATRRHFSAEDKIRIVLEGLRGEASIAELCRHEGIVQNLYYRWSKEFLEAGKKRLAGDPARAATTDEVKELRREAGALKEVVAELTLENRLLNPVRCVAARHPLATYTFTYTIPPETDAFPRTTDGTS
jgi:transposase